MGYYQLTSSITFYYHIIPPENRWIYTPMRAGGGLVGKLEAPVEPLDTVIIMFPLIMAWSFTLSHVSH